MHCLWCQSAELIKRGKKDGHQRFRCRSCGRYGTDKVPKFSAQTKAMAIQMYLNSMGIRSIGRVLGASPASVLNWIRKEHGALQQRLARMAEPIQAHPAHGPDIIEMDEIYTYVQKNGSER